VRRLWPFRHFGLKVLSFAIAVMLWMVVSGDEIVERGLRVPLELQQLPAGVELTGEVPATVDVRVRGGSTALSRVSPTDVVAMLDLRSAQPGRRVFPMTQDQVRVPFGVDVVQITPSAIAMVFETSASKQVPVAPAVEGRPAPGYVVGSMIAEPAAVDVVGPESAVKRLTEAVTEPVSVEGARDRVRATVRLGVVDAALRLKTSRAAVVTVQIFPAPLERTFRTRPVHLRNVAANLTARAEPAVVEVTLRGSRETLGRVDPDQVVAYVDLGGLGIGQYQLTVHADATRDAGVTHMEPSTVQIWIGSAR
jgi:YbbR domain-containing protein